MDLSVDFVAQIERHTEALVSLAARTDSGTEVPTCPGWVMDDLVWHLFEVQHFWHHVITTRPAAPDNYEQPHRTASTPPAALGEICTALTQALRRADPHENAWSWSVAADQQVGFTMRRQAHEAYVHLIDGLEAAAEPRPAVDRAFAVDGVDEVLGVAIAATPDWSEFRPTSEPTNEPFTEIAEVRLSEGGERFLLRFGRQVGLRPRGNASIDDPAVALVSPSA